MTPERLEHVRAVYARVLAEIRANPPRGPLLGETPNATTCRRGHPMPDGGRCKECRNAARRARYTEVRGC